MSGLSKLRDQMTPGTVLTCIRNTKKPKRDGARQTVRSLDGNTVACETEHRDPVTVTLPTRRCDVEWLDDVTVRWPLDNGSRRLVGDTVTWLIETPVED